LDNIKKDEVFVGRVAENEKTFKSVALGEEGPEVEIVEVAPQPQTQEERINLIEIKMIQLALSIESIHSIIKKLRGRADAKRDYAISEKIEKTKSDMKIPEGTVLVGITKGISYYCEVKNGAFYIGITRYPTLSAAAAGVSGVRRSGWTFWKLSGGKHNGKTVKEVFK
jgi:hypothetical protein